MNLLNLRRRTRRRTGLLTTQAIANSAIDQDLNEGYYLLASLLARYNEDYFEEQKVKFNLGLNSGLYSQPLDLLKWKQLRLSYSTVVNEGSYVIAEEYDPATIDRTSFEESEVTTTNPIVDITNNYFRIRPRPTTAITNGGELYYIARPSALTLTSDSPVFDIQFQDAISVYAAMMECSADASLYDKYTVYKGEWADVIAKLQALAPDRNINRQQRFRSIKEVGRIPYRRELR